MTLSTEDQQLDQTSTSSLVLRTPAQAKATRQVPKSHEAVCADQKPQTQTRETAAFCRRKCWLFLQDSRSKGLKLWACHNCCKLHPKNRMEALVARGHSNSPYTHRRQSGRNDARLRGAMCSGTNRWQSSSSTVWGAPQGSQAATVDDLK